MRCLTSAEPQWAACRRALGWLHHERGVPLAELRLSHLLPSSGRVGVAPAFDYVQWLAHERGVSAFTQGGLFWLYSAVHAHTSNGLLMSPAMSCMHVCCCRRILCMVAHAGQEVVGNPCYGVGYTLGSLQVNGDRS